MTPVLIRDSLEDAYDAFRRDADLWQGRMITRFSAVLDLVDE